MTKRDYVVIANAIKGLSEDIQAEVTEKFIQALRNDRYEFDSGKFRKCISK